MSKSDRGLVFGVDLGKASCGLAIIDYEAKEVKLLSSRIIKAPENRSGKSLAAVRREKRSTRRQIDRRAARKKNVLKVLKQFGVTPQDSDCTWFGTKKNGNDGIDLPVIVLRSQGLDRQLSNREWARILYWFCSQRGYINRGEETLINGETSVEGTSESEEAGKVLSAISENKKALKESGYRTFGEYLYKESYVTTHSYRNKAGDYKHCVSHPMVVDEIKELFEQQKKFGNTHTSEEFKDAYLEQLNWLKDTKAFDKLTYQKVGYCVYFDQYSDEPQKRAANADLISEVVKAYEKLGNIRLKFDDKPEQSLTREVRDAVINEMFSVHQGAKVKSVTFKTLRKLIDDDNLVGFKGVKSDLEKNPVFVPKAWNTFCRVLSASESGIQLLNRMKNDFKLANAIAESLTYASSLDSLERRISMYQEKESLEISEDELALIESLPYNTKIFKGYGSRSIQALEMLHDQFLDGEAFTLDEAEKQSGLQGFRLREKGIRQSLLLPYSDYDVQCTNPVVLRVLAQARRMINSAIKQYGMPNIIRIELGNDIAKSAKEKSKIAKGQNENRKENERIKDKIAELLHIDQSEVTGKQITKMKLYEEQGGKDIYTGEGLGDIAFAGGRRFLIDDNYCEIDHVLPYSRSADDLKSNKVLVLAKSNQEKGNRTPYEWMNSNDGSHPNWEQFCLRVSSNVRLSDGKKSKLLEENFAEKETSFIKRNMVDTQYMARAISAWLSDSLNFSSEFDQKQHVYAVNGRMTAKLRRKWGLNFGEDDTKDRSDNRHHAIDAAVIAACSASMVKEFAISYSRLREVRDSVIAEPWEGFADQVREARKWVIPTMYRPNKKNGLIYEETKYKYLGKEVGDKKIVHILKGKKQGVGTVDLFRDPTGGQFARILGDRAYIRLWLDEEGKSGRGEWLIEPVYFADLDKIKRGSYVPRYIPRQKVTTQEWESIPPRITENSIPIVLRNDDIVRIDGIYGRLSGLDINSKRLKFDRILSKDVKTIGSWTKDTSVEVIHEDCLGLMWFNLLKDQNSKES
ncbi:CRISPR-associated protein Cas9/Csn1, subtype II/NMEMI [Atopobium sp. ICM42b]|uniref:type II CRISPR RNA-guided endonuclease Cas9 n=1 Tax=Atopobium sp. ICM42b TaxID=1190620 RepID=UPI00044761C7|nr:type II CRISPR RNA-guided endonuclease Cas9 [Atopobium sp. ICM42b]EWC94390.1 CRISPR-associated protein Cas9/Csn1, subtype II/NMEMI [Atopobium sp. ICM42b]